MDTSHYFQSLYGCGNRCIWGDFHLKMDVVIVGINRDDVECGILFHRFVKQGQKFGFNIVFQKLPAVFGSPDYMILMLIG